jgi:hypothetical protein
MVKMFIIIKNKFIILIKIYNNKIIIHCQRLNRYNKMYKIFIKIIIIKIIIKIIIIRIKIFTKIIIMKTITINYNSKTSQTNTTPSTHSEKSTTNNIQIIK